MKYLLPAINMLTPPGAQFEPDSVQFQSWVQAVAAEQALHKNEVLRYVYLNTDFQSWLSNYSQGRLNGGDPNTPPPMPPNSFNVFVAEDGITCDFVQNGPPVCPVPSYKKINPPQTQEQAGEMLRVLGGNSSGPSRFNGSVVLYTQKVKADDGSLFIRVG